MNAQNNYHNEVNLLNFFSIIAKRKRMVLAVFFITVLAAFAVSYFKRPPELYIVTEVIKVPTLGIDKNLPLVREKLSKKIQEGVYDYKICEEIGLTPARHFGFEVDVPEKNDFIKIKLTTEKEGVALAERVLNGLFKILEDEYLKRIAAEKSMFEYKANMLENEVSKAELVKDKIDRKIQSRQEEIKGLENERKAWLSYIQLLDEREDLLTKEMSLIQKDAREGKLARDLTTLTHTNFLNIQLNSLSIRRQELMSQIRTINNNIGSIKLEIADLEDKKLKMIETDIRGLQIEMHKLKTEEQFVNNFVQLQPPLSLPISQIGTSRIRKVFAAGMIGLIFGAFLALFLEFWQKVKQSTTKDKK